MDDAQIWLLVAGLAAATWAIRFSFIGLLAGRTLPPLLLEALSYVPVTVLPALIAPMVLIEDGVLTADPVRIAAASMGLALGIGFRNIFAAIAGAMLTFVGLSALGL